MRVISKSSDYYDIGLRQGIEPKCVYVRKTREMTYEGPTADNPDWLRLAFGNEAFASLVQDLDRRKWDADGDYVDEVVVLFCGQLYLGVRYGGSYHWSFADLIAAIAAGPDCPAKRVLAEKRKNERAWFLPRYRELEGAWNLADSLNGNRRLLDEVSIGAGTPILAFRPARDEGARWNRFRTRVILDPVLKELGFASVLPPYQAFQELSMYLTNVITIPENPTCEVSDADKAAKHGYNELSFRHPNKL